jgi:hypothetical protein
MAILGAWACRLQDNVISKPGRELARGMAGEGQRQIVRMDAAAVVHHLDQRDAALRDLDVEPVALPLLVVLQPSPPSP